MHQHCTDKHILLKLRKKINFLHQIIMQIMQVVVKSTLFLYVKYTFACKVNLI